MKKISNEEAQKFVPHDYTRTSLPPPHYTVKIEEDGWEKIEYYTYRLRQSVNGNDGDQSVYILENKSMPGMVKIGYTKGDPNDRADQLSKGTGIPTPHKVVYSYNCFNGERIERAVHKILKNQRVRTEREFFYITVEDAKRIINETGKKYD
tara:strand:- start:251 stop:703 length:453 start_codon:yes stop_codon:yes gene_type:complete